jgi:SAM-dependent methyltransferase
MFAGETPESIAVYNRVGQSACSKIEEVLRLTDRSFEDIEELLDFGSGYGRVTRALVQKVASQKISVFDVDLGAVLFCATEFNVRPLKFKKKSVWDFETVPFSTYDVIWAGSVFTHLSENYSEETLSTINRLLKPKGVVVFTTHGEDTFRRIENGFYGERIQSLMPRILDDYNRAGFAFIPYNHAEVEVLPFPFIRAKDFGMAWMSSSFVDTLMSKVSSGRSARIFYEPIGWESHQDVYCFQQAAG